MYLSTCIYTCYLRTYVLCSPVEPAHIYVYSRYVQMYLCTYIFNCFVYSFNMCKSSFIWLLTVSTCTVHIILSTTDVFKSLVPSAVDEELIANRTRSKFPIEVSLEEIEGTCMCLCIYVRILYMCVCTVHTFALLTWVILHRLAYSIGLWYTYIWYSAPCLVSPGRRVHLIQSLAHVHYINRYW